jgi:competence protein ComEC
MVVVTAVLAVSSFVVAGESLPDGSVTVLDVGQGDSILIHGGNGRYALVDGGPDSSVLVDRLHHYGVKALELIVVSHVHADHVTGLTGVIGNMPVGEIWVASEPHTTPAFADLEDAVGSSGLALRRPAVGRQWGLGELTLEVNGPLRRYASPNDQSMVLTVTGPGRSMLLTGDIETYAQSELTGLHADVLKVPHQGASTSDPEWLSSVGAELAIISVGPNQFGHPSEGVIELLESGGAEVRRTDRDGDVVIDLTEKGA